MYITTKLTSLNPRCWNNNDKRVANMLRERVIIKFANKYLFIFLNNITPELRVNFNFSIKK